MINGKNFYEILGLGIDAEDVVIKAAYRSLSQKYHPDKWNGDPAISQEKMAEINRAYETLIDPAKRSVYDNQLRSSEKNQNAKNERSKERSDSKESEKAEKSAPKDRSQSNSKRLIILAIIVVTTLIGLVAIPTHKDSDSRDANSSIGFNSMDVTGADWGQTYSLPDLNGRRRTPKDFQGKVTAVFFGFLYCPDACPAHLTKMLALKERLGKDADKLQVVFITVDPERDQPRALKTFLASFDSSFIGLRGSRKETDLTAKSFRVFFKKVPGPKANEDPMSYTIDHTTFTYLFDPSGTLRLVSPHDLSLEELAHDVKKLLRPDAK